MSVSAAKLRANRLNALNSTGPRSAEGKARSAQNATTHGLFCRDLLVGEEDAEALLALQNDVMHRMQPRDAMEAALADTYIRASWTLRRLRGVERLVYLNESDLIQQRLETSFKEHPEPGVAGEIESCVPGADLVMLRLMDAKDQRLEKLSRYEQRLLNTMRRCVRDLAKMQEEEILPIEDVATEADQAAQEALSAASNVQNEPTGPADDRNDGDAAELREAAPSAPRSSTLRASDSVALPVESATDPTSRFAA